MSVVVFNWSLFAARYPEFAAMSQPLAQLYFNDATDIIDNTDVSPVPDVPAQAGTRTRLLMAATAHIAAMNATIAGVAPSNLVGRISNATQGSVTVAAQMDVPGGSAQWWNQTKYGAQAWLILAQFRTAVPVAGPVRDMNPWGTTPGSGPW